MSPAAILYLAGMALVLGGERLFSGSDPLRWGLDGAGALLLLLGLAARARQRTPTPSHRVAVRAAMIATLAGLGSLAIYALSRDWFPGLLGLGDQAHERWCAAFGATWPVLWLAGTLPLLAIDRVLRDAPVVLQPLRTRQAAANSLAAALALALVFPVNFLAQQHNHRWDLSYFKTTSAGSATIAMVQNLEEPVTVRVFLPPSSDVEPELRSYLQPLEGPTLKVEWLDHAAEPRLAKKLRVRDNGYIAITRGEPDLDHEGTGRDDSVTKTLKVGVDLDQARRTLKKLDSEFQKLLLKVAMGQRVAYVVTGHDELGWRGGGPPDRKASDFKRLLEAMSFKVKELGAAQGLADAVPDDADVLVILGPRSPFLAPEADAVQRYLQGGGSLLLALEPDFGVSRDVELPRQGPDPLDQVLDTLGLHLGEGVLASQVKILPITNQLVDRVNVATNRFSSHDSSTTLARYSGQLFMGFSAAGWLDEAPDHASKVTVTVRSQPENWADLDGDLALGAGEKKKIRPIAAAVTGGTGETAWRAMVVADATAFSDLLLRNIRGNQQYVYDGLNWLIGEEASSGVVEDEQDVKIQHTKENQVAWFYGTILGVPLVVFLVGLLRISRRRGQGGEA